jgi:hypothetical protein
MFQGNSGYVKVWKLRESVGKVYNYKNGQIPFGLEKGTFLG